jgi:hypothetical protein
MGTVLSTFILKTSEQLRHSNKIAVEVAREQGAKLNLAGFRLFLPVDG